MSDWKNTVCPFEGLGIFRLFSCSKAMVMMGRGWREGIVYVRIACPKLSLC